MTKEGGSFKSQAVGLSKLKVYSLLSSHSEASSQIQPRQQPRKDGEGGTASGESLKQSSSMCGFLGREVTSQLLGKGVHPLCGLISYLRLSEAFTHQHSHN